MTNVLITIIDGLRADHMGAFGYQRPVTPRLDRLAADARGQLFSTVFSPSTQAAPAVASLLTGCYPPTHGVRGEDGQINPGVPHLPTLLQAAGYHTMGISAAALAGQMGFGVGCDRFVEAASTVTPGRDAPATAQRAEQVEGTVGAWLEEMAQAPGRRWLLWLWAPAIHAPFRPPPEYDRWRDHSYRGRVDGSYESLRRNPSRADVQQLIDLYDGAVTHADALLGRLLDRLVALNLYDDTLIVVTSGHGESLGEEGAFGHGYLAYEEVVRVPLVVKLPAGTAPAGGTSTTMVELVDVAPTLLDWLGLRPLAAGMQGYSLAPGLRGSLPGREVAYAETVTAATGQRLLAVRNERWKLLRSDPPAQASSVEGATAEQGGWRRRLSSTWRQIAGGQPVGQMLRDPATALRRRLLPREMLFDLQADPAARANVLDLHEAASHQMRAMLEAWLAECRVYAGLNEQRMASSGQAGAAPAYPPGLGMPVAGDDAQRAV